VRQERHTGDDSVVVDLDPVGPCALGNFTVEKNKISMSAWSSTNRVVVRIERQRNLRFSPFENLVLVVVLRTNEA
jgi:hypothetical protein